MKKQPEIDAFDEIINKNMITYQTLSKINFKIDGVSNGAYLYRTFPFKCIAQFQVVNRDGIIGFDLLIIAAEPVFKENGQEWVSNEENYVQRVKLCPLHFLGRQILSKIQEIQSVRIEMKQYPKEQNKIVVLTSITQKKKKERKDKIYFFSINPQKIKTSSQMNIMSLNCSDEYIQDFCWHPSSQFNLLVLLSNQRLEIWNPIQSYNNKFIKPEQIIDLRDYVKISQKNHLSFIKISLVDTIYPEIAPLEKKVAFQKFFLFLSTLHGDIYSLYPFLPEGTEISNDQLQLIFNDKESQQLDYLRLLLNQSGLQFNQETEKFSVTASQQQKFKLFKWLPIATQQSVNKTLTGLQIYPLTVDSSLIVQVYHKNSDNGDMIKLSLLSNDFESILDDQQEKIYYPIRTIVVQNVDYKGDECRLIQLNSKIKGDEYLQKQKGIYFVHSNGVYKLDIEAVYRFLETKKLSFLQNQNSLSTLLILRVPQEQMIQALQLELADKIINFVRRGRKKLKFEMQTIENLSSFSQIEYISKRSRQILSKLQSLCVEEKPAKQQEEKKEYLPQLSSSKQKVKRLGGGVEEFKLQYKSFAESIKNRIDRSMANLKTNYELMNKKLSGFKNLQEKGGQLNILYQQIENNNKEITKLFQTDIGKRRKCELEKNIDDFRNVIAINNSYRIDRQVEQELSEKIAQLEKDLKNVKENLDDLKENSKKLKSRR